MDEQQRVDLTISGRVQGVGYRYSVLLKARSFNLKGFARNLSNGNVHVSAQGSSDAIEKLIQWCYQGPPAAMVRDIRILPKKLEEFHDFDILY